MITSSARESGGSASEAIIYAHGALWQIRDSHETTCKSLVGIRAWVPMVQPPRAVGIIWPCEIRSTCNAQSQTLVLQNGKLMAMVWAGCVRPCLRLTCGAPARNKVWRAVPPPPGVRGAMWASETRLHGRSAQKRSRGQRSTGTESPWACPSVAFERL